MKTSEPIIRMGLSVVPNSFVILSMDMVGFANSYRQEIRPKLSDSGSLKHLNSSNLVERFTCLFKWSTIVHQNHMMHKKRTVNFHDCLSVRHLFLITNGSQL